MNGTFTYNSPGTPGVCGSLFGQANFSYDRDHYDTIWNGSVYPGFGGWFLLTIDGSNVEVGGLNDILNYLVLPVSGVDSSCEPVTDTFLEHPISLSSDQCNDALRLGLQAEIDAILTNDPSADFKSLAGSKSLTTTDDTCQVTWNLTKAPSA